MAYVSVTSQLAHGASKITHKVNMGHASTAWEFEGVDDKTRTE